jgi:hypothetical protein
MGDPPTCELGWRPMSFNRNEKCRMSPNVTSGLRFGRIIWHVNDLTEAAEKPGD